MIFFMFNLLDSTLILLKKIAVKPSEIPSHAYLRTLTQISLTICG